MSKHLTLLGLEGKTLARDFVVRLLKSGVKPSITGDLWSEGGMGLFGIYAHGITETWVIEKALIGLVACASERHTAKNIRKWTGGRSTHKHWVYTTSPHGCLILYVQSTVFST